MTRTMPRLWSQRASSHPRPLFFLQPFSYVANVSFQNSYSMRSFSSPFLCLELGSHFPLRALFAPSCPNPVQLLYAAFSMHSTRILFTGDHVQNLPLVIKKVVLRNLVPAKSSILSICSVSSLCSETQEPCSFLQSRPHHAAHLQGMSFHFPILLSDCCHH